MDQRSELELLRTIKSARDSGDQRAELEALRKIKGASGSKPPITVPDDQPAGYDASAAQYILAPLGHGLARAGAGVGQVAREGAEKLGVDVFDESAADYTQRKEAEFQHFKETPIGKDIWGKVGTEAGNALPFMATPGGGAKLMSKIGAGVLTGGLMGGTQFVPEGEDRLMSMAGGAAGGGAAVPIAHVAGKMAAKGMATAKGVFDEATQRVLDAAKKHRIPVQVPDLSRNPALRKLGTMLEELPMIGTRGDRLEQMQASKMAAEELAESFRPFGVNGDTGTKVQQSIARKTELLRGIKNSKYDKVAKHADSLLSQDGNIAHVATPEMNKAAAELIKAQRKQPLEYVDDGLIKAIEKYTVDPERNFKGLQLLRAKIGERIRHLESGKLQMASSEEMASLRSIKSALETDMETFATTNGDDLNRLWRNADKFYREKYLPVAASKDIKRALETDEPDRILEFFIKDKFEGRARKLYHALDNEGRGAVRYAVVRKAFDNAWDAEREIFSPAKFATAIKKQEDAIGVFFRGKDKGEVVGFQNLMRHVERAGQVFENPPTGNRLVPLAMGAAGMGAFSYDPTTTLGALGLAVSGKYLFTTSAGRKLLLSSAKAAPGSPALDKISEAAQKLMVRTAASAAAQLTVSPNRQ